MKVLRPGIKYTAQEIEQAIELWVQGITTQDIAAQLGRTPQSVRDMLKRQRELGRQVPARTECPVMPEPQAVTRDHVFRLVSPGGQSRPVPKDYVFRLYGVTSRDASRGSL